MTNFGTKLLGGRSKLIHIKIMYNSKIFAYKIINFLNKSYFSFNKKALLYLPRCIFSEFTVCSEPVCFVIVLEMSWKLMMFLPQKYEIYGQDSIFAFVLFVPLIVVNDKKLFILILLSRVITNLKLSKILARYSVFLCF